jgi:Lrp/AsnC family transcriptional regulator for asnA, asnC and gidA
MRNGPLIDDLDSKIIQSLQSDGRLPNTEIARRLGVAEATVRNRIERLLRDGVMQIGAWADPLKIGYQVYAIIELQVTLRDIEKVAERLAKLPEIFFLGTCLGNFDIFAAALFRSNEHLHAFLTKHLCRVPGLERASTTSLTRILKREYRYPMAVANEDGVFPADGLGDSRARPQRRRFRPRRQAGIRDLSPRTARIGGRR